MADTVTTQVLENGSQWFRVKLTNFSDGSGETAVVKVDPTSAASGANNMGVVIQGQTFYPGVHLKLMEMTYNVAGMTLLVQWDASTKQDMWYLQGFGGDNFRKRGGLYVPQSSGAPVAGATGKVLFTTEGAAGGSSYTVDMTFKKDIVQ